MNEYKPRNIEFKELLEINDWKVKVYTISRFGQFNYPLFYKNVLKKLPDWLKMKNSFATTGDKVAFLILHSGSDGIYSLINWWVGGNMLNTHVFLTPDDETEIFTKISGDGLGPCPWELEVIHHEGRSWLKHVLKSKSNPNLEGYLKDVINSEI
jgi:hypothetical protein